MVSWENTSKYGRRELDRDGKFALEFLVSVGHTKKGAGFQPPAEEGLQASFASGDEKMQMARLKRGGLRVLVKVGTSAGEERM